MLMYANLQQRHMLHGPKWVCLLLVFVTLTSTSNACRDYTDNPGGIIYEVAGESVIPGIDCKNVGSIFEEHTLCNELDALSAQRNVFALSERKFDFGAVLAAVGGAASQPGVKANLKFTNIFKVCSKIHLPNSVSECCCQGVQLLDLFVCTTPACKLVRFCLHKLTLCTHQYLRWLNP